MITSIIDRETYKRNKVKELMSLETDSDNEWFEENNLITSNKPKTENKSISHENKGGNQPIIDLTKNIDNFDINDSLSLRLDAFQEKINAMLAEGNKMLNQNITRKNVDLPFDTTTTTTTTKRRHRNSQNKSKVVFSSDTHSSSKDNLEKSLNSQNFIENNTSSIKKEENKHIQGSSVESLPENKSDNKKYEKSNKSSTESNRKLDGKNMLQDALSFSKLVLNNQKNNTFELKRSNSPNPTVQLPTQEKVESPKLTNTKKSFSKKGESIDTLLTQSLNDGESILQTNEMELLLIELKELKEKNKQLQHENMNLKIKNSLLTEKQKQQEQQIEKLKQKNSQLQRLLTENNSSSTTPSNYPPSPYTESSNQSTDSDWNNSIILSPTQNNTINKINPTMSPPTNNDIPNVMDSDENDEKANLRKIKNIKDMENRRFSFPQKVYSVDNVETNNNNNNNNNNNLSIHKEQYHRTRSNSNISFYHSLPKNKSLLYANDNKRHSMFADIRGYDKIIENWKQIENKENQNSNSHHQSKAFDEGKVVDNSNIETVKTDRLNQHYPQHYQNNNININNTKSNHKKYSFSSHASNKDKIKRYSYLSDISPLDEMKYDIHQYKDSFHDLDVTNNKKNRVRKISESYANDLLHRDNILKHCSLSPPKFKYSDLDLMAGYNESLSTSTSHEPKIDKAHKRKSILDQISYIRIDDESINNIKNQVQHRMSISSKTLPIDIYNSSPLLDSSSQISDPDEQDSLYHEPSFTNKKSLFHSGNKTDHHNENNNYKNNRNNNENNKNNNHSYTDIDMDSHIHSNPNEPRIEINHTKNKNNIENNTSNKEKTEIRQLNHRLSIFKNQIQNVQKDLTDMLECEKRIQDLLIPINNFQK